MFVLMIYQPESRRKIIYFFMIVGCIRCDSIYKDSFLLKKIDTSCQQLSH